MKQINNGFLSIYYLTEEGQVFNARLNRFLKPTGNSYKLRTTEKQSKSMPICELYPLVYGKKFIQDDIERLEGEIFKYIPDTDEKYLISNYGRCISYNQGGKAKLVKPILNYTGGYERVTIKVNGEFKKKLVHVLVAQSFCKSDHPEANQVHHKDYNVLNNRADNLEYLTQQQHIATHIQHSKENQHDE